MDHGFYVVATVAGLEGRGLARVSVVVEASTVDHAEGLARDIFQKGKIKWRWLNECRDLGPVGEYHCPPIEQGVSRFSGPVERRRGKKSKGVQYSQPSLFG